jgi:streptogramin lyase
LKRSIRIAAGLAAAMLVLGAAEAHAAAAESSLTGRVSAPRQGPLEGVLVSARLADSSITYTVVSDRRGRFSFAPAHLAPGKYALRIRAAGYELEGPQEAAVPGRVEIKLRHAADLAAQLTNAEWLMSMPGTAAQKRPLIECMSCHTLERIARSRAGAAELLTILKRMVTYANNSTTTVVQMRRVDRKFDAVGFRQLADYLATVNLSARPAWPYPLKTLPRPKGAATRVLITEYDLPRKTIAPHDAVLGADGMVWYSNFVENFLGRLDPKTGAHTEFAFPVAKPGMPTGALDLEQDGDGNWWLAPVFQTGLVEFDVKSQAFSLFPLAPEMNSDASQQTMVMPRRSRVDGRVWTNEGRSQAVMRLDIASGRYELFEPFKGLPRSGSHFPYGLAADAGNNLYFMDFAGESVGRIDAATGQTTLYPTPTPRSRPRRTMMDAQGRIWLAEYAANQVAMFDPKEESFKEWPVPTPHTYPYDVYFDRHGELWAGSMSTDRVLRFHSGVTRPVEYLLPRQSNIRRVFVDDSTHPGTFWAGSNHGASIIRLTPLD